MELLAPAGNMEKMKMALLYGADAVYMAGKAFGLRAYGGNFTREEMKEAVEYAHSMGKKVYSKGISAGASVMIGVITLLMHI